VLEGDAGAFGYAEEGVVGKDGFHTGAAQDKLG
jgi:hypothetical protein